MGIEMNGPERQQSTRMRKPQNLLLSPLAVTTPPVSKTRDLSFLLIKILSLSFLAENRRIR